MFATGMAALLSRDIVVLPRMTLQSEWLLPADVIMSFRRDPYEKQ